MAQRTADEALGTVLVMFKKMSYFYWLKIVHLVKSIELKDWDKP